MSKRQKVESGPAHGAVAVQGILDVRSEVGIINEKDAAASVRNGNRMGAWG